MIETGIDTPRQSERPARDFWRGIAGKLLLSYLIVTGIAIATLFVGTSYLAPTFFDLSMHMDGTDMMLGSGQGMMDSMNAVIGEAVNRAFHQSVTSSLLLASGAGLLGAIVASLLLARRIVAPLRRMASASHRIANGHYAERVPDADGDELGDLGRSFNLMASSLEEAEQRRLALIADVAHELRTPLSSIEGYAEGLIDGVVEATPETFAVIHHEAGRLTRLVADLQELSRAEAKQITLDVQPLAVDRMVAAAIARLRPQFEDKGIALEAELADHLPPVLADEDRTVQVLTNLMGNALRYTSSGGRVAVRARPLGSQVELEVADTGIGIAPEHLPHVFERFYRVDRSRSRAAGGSGIGLAIARHLVEAQGGTIRAASPGIGQGSTFTFSLPVAPDPIGRILTKP